VIFELIKFICFGSTLSYLHKEFRNPCPPHTRTKYNPPPSKFWGTIALKKVY